VVRKTEEVNGKIKRKNNSRKKVSGVNRREDNITEGKTT
jgi:hypothetical protein